MRRYYLIGLLAVLVLTACEGHRNNTSWSGSKPGTKIVPPLKAAAADSSRARADSTSTGTTQEKH